ncbi:MAG TPA: secretin N-terminal domain-containing protein [Trueperaceae bacterium]|nr:secretin N-terminal domain-containing protein [Trueperaceae bacterium]
MKRTLILLTFLALAGLALAQTQLAPLPKDPRFDQTVQLATGVGGESLRAIVSALAKSVGLTAIVNDVPDKTISYDIGSPKPFRLVWSIVLTDNDLQYALLDNDVVVVGPPSAVAKFQQPKPVASTEQKPAAPPPPNTVQRFYKVNNDPGTVVQILQRSIPGLDVQSLPGVKSIVVVATQDTQDKVQNLLQQFDTPTQAEPLEQRTYQLSNANAEDLAKTLQSSGVVTQQTGQSGQAGQTGTVSTQNFKVVADKRTNSLIVTATAPVQARIAQLIPQLDKPQKQVNIQVRIQEVTNTTAYDLGLNLQKATFGNLAASILDTGLKFVFDMSTVSPLNINAVLNALEEQGLSRLVDDSNITVLDNETGSIQSGGTIYISIPGANQNIERTIPYGVEVDVTPRIANDGRVTLVITAKVQDVLSTTNDPSFLNLSTRAVTSTVTLAPGQTALLGGLLQNSLTVDKKSLPVIGAIPILGDLLGHSTSTSKAGDLMLVVNAQTID